MSTTAADCKPGDSRPTDVIASWPVDYVSCALRSAHVTTSLSCLSCLCLVSVRLTCSHRLELSVSCPFRRRVPTLGAGSHAFVDTQCTSYRQLAPSLIRKDHQEESRERCSSASASLIRCAQDVIALTQLLQQPFLMRGISATWTVDSLARGQAPASLQYMDALACLA
jgi:hypothetical protein